ncbi:MAG TPA: iron-containing alcohol dehydrogenase, partial [Candidatus Limnocylindrales bacterium]|nr:iron-containing alcohol dehydrogenase [Candidatus Limnocylindrales bacterium]
MIELPRTSALAAGYAARTIEIVARDRARFGAGVVRELPAILRLLGAGAAFVVTDAGVVRSGVAGRVTDLLRGASIETEVFDGVEPNPGTASILGGSERLRALRARAAVARANVVVVGLGGGSAMDSAKAIALHATNQRDVMSLGYHDETLVTGVPVVAIPTTAGTGAETNTYGVITDESVGRKGYVGHESVLPRVAVLDPELTLGLPAGPTASTGVDALTHSLESLLSRNPNPLAEAIALGTIRTVGEWLPIAVEDGSNLEARSRMLLAAHYAGLGQQTGTGVGAVHAIGHAVGTRGRLPHGTALATVMPEVLATYLPVRSRELALMAIAFGVAGPDDPPAAAARAGIDALDDLLRRVGQRRTLFELGLSRETFDTLAQDAVEDVAINNSPRVPSKP